MFKPRAQIDTAAHMQSLSPARATLIASGAFSVWTMCPMNKSNLI